MNALDTIRDIIQVDIGNRGLRTDPVDNLITACAGDFRAACLSLAETTRAVVGIITGFWIPGAEPPAGETDGPLGALFLARALVPLGMRVVLITDEFCREALEAGLEACDLRRAVLVLALPPVARGGSLPPLIAELPRQGFSHLIAIERVGPSHTLASVRSQPGAGPGAVEQFLGEIPPEHHDRCHTMKGVDITDEMSPAHQLFEAARTIEGVTTIGIGDGGNEIGMGKIPWEIIRRNIPRGGLVACRVPTDHLIVCGVSNWGAYGLAGGVRLLRGAAPEPGLFDQECERDLLRIMVERGPLVDGVIGKPLVSVDGLPFDRFAEVLREVGRFRHCN
jgi:hypothetical protein